MSLLWQYLVQILFHTGTNGGHLEKWRPFCFWSWLTCFSERGGFEAPGYQVWCLYHHVKDSFNNLSHYYQCGLKKTASAPLTPAAVLPWSQSNCPWLQTTAAFGLTTFWDVWRCRLCNEIHHDIYLHRKTVTLLKFNLTFVSNSIKHFD